MGKVYNNGIVSPKGFDMAASEPVDQREIVESINDLVTLPQCYPGIEVKIVGEQYKEYKLVRLPSGDIDNWIEVVPEYNQPAQQTTDSVLNRSNLPGTNTTEALNSLAFGATGTYEEIKAIRDGDRLTPGSRYTITDYQTKYFIEGSNSSGIVAENTIAALVSGFITWTKGYDTLLEVGMTITISELPDGYVGPHIVGEQALCTEAQSDYYFRFDNGMHLDPEIVGAKIVYYLDRYDNTPNDTVVSSNGKPVIQPNGVVNTDVHDGTAYMDMSASQNLAVPTEEVVLLAATSNSFQPAGFSGTFLGDSIYYDMDDTEILNDNNQTIATRNGRIFRRINKLGTVDLPVDWRVHRYRRWLIDGPSRTKMVNKQHPRDTVTAGSFVNGEIYDIVTVGTTDFTLIGAADNNIGTRFTATGVGTGTGTAVTETLTRNPETGDAMFTLAYVDETTDLEKFYRSYTLEDSINTIGRWGAQETFQSAVEAIDRAIDFPTIPITGDGEYNPGSKVVRCKFDGVWENVILNDWSPISFYQFINVEASGALRRCQIGQGMQALQGSAFVAQDWYAADLVLSGSGFQGALITRCDLLGPFVTENAYGIDLWESIFSTCDADSIAGDSDTYSWINFGSMNSVKFHNSAYGTRTGNTVFVNMIIRNSLVHAGISQSGVATATSSPENIFFSAGVLSNLALLLFKKHDRLAFPNWLMPNTNPGKTTGDKWVFQLQSGATDFRKILSFNETNGQIVERALDASNVEVNTTYSISDNR